MGDTNMDMSRSKIFNAAVYACAAVGAGVGAVTYGGGTLGSMIAMGAMGAVAGGVGVPLALTGVAVLGYVGYVGIKSTIKALKKEGAAVPLGMAIVGLSAAKALFVTPVKALAGLLPKKDKDNDTQKPPARSADSSSDQTSGFFSREKLKQTFAAALKPLRREKTAKPAPAPKPQNAPKPPAV
ncbi:MAG: hypothetical protein ACK4PK_02765 [Alphaproteobacteria bacterium]